MEQVLSFLGMPAAFIALYVFIAGIFSAIEKVASKQARADTAHYLKTADFPAMSRSLHEISSELIDRVFGKNHFSIQVLVNSSAFSIVSILLLVLIALAIDYLEVRSFDYLIHFSVYWNYLFLGVLRGGADLTAFLIWIGWFLLINYFNLYKTRWIIRFLAMHKFGMMRGIGIICFDYAFGLTIFICGIALFALIIFPLLFGDRDVMPIGGLGDRLISIVLREHRYADLPAIVFEHAIQPYSITSWFFYVGMLPSVWLWLYILSAMLTKVTVKSANIVRFLRYFVDLEKKPFQLIGYFAGLIVVLVFGFGYGIFRIVISLSTAV